VRIINTPCISQCPDIIARIREKQDKYRTKRLEAGNTQTDAVKRSASHTNGHGDEAAAHAPAAKRGNAT
jgi:hypothetical protein